MLEDFVVKTEACIVVTMGLTFKDLVVNCAILKVVRNGQSLNNKNKNMIANVLLIIVLFGIVSPP